jgi:hypothetical protein
MCEQLCKSLFSARNAPIANLVLAASSVNSVVLRFVDYIIEPGLFLIP